jgi:hypothetical protein
MTPYVNDLFAAYQNIPATYFNDRVIHSHGDQNIDHQKIERVINAELYHQWRILIDNEHLPNFVGDRKYTDLILHSEIGKRLSPVDLNNRSKHPDLVLHGGQDGANCRPPYNKVFVELKIDNYEKKDITKGFLALNDPFRYESWVYIIHNLSLEDISAIPANSTRWRTIRDRMCFINRANGIIKLSDII